MASCGDCNKPADMVLLIDNSKSVMENYRKHSEYIETAANFVDLWYEPYEEFMSSVVASSALICRFSNRLQVDAKMIAGDQFKSITYYDYGNAHGPGKIPPHDDFLVKKTPYLTLTAAKHKLAERLDATGRYGDPLPVGEEKWAWRGNEVNLNPRRNRAEYGAGTGSRFFYSMLGDLNNFVKDNNFLAQNAKSFLFVLTDSSPFTDDPQAWKEEDLQMCTGQVSNDFPHPYQLYENDVCDIFRGLAQSFRNVFSEKIYFQIEGFD